MRSAVYYPRTQVQSEPLMKRSLLLWDRLHTIVPGDWYQVDYAERVDMDAAWELIGATLVPSEAQKSRTHDAMVATLSTRAIKLLNLWILRSFITNKSSTYETFI